MTVIRYIGNRDVLSDGKILFEILAQLKNFGVGRVVTKNEWSRKWPDQPSYCLVKKVECDMDRWLRHGKMWADFVYRGKPLGVFEFSHSLDRSDWRLVHKCDEENFKKCENPFICRKIPSKIPLPPLQRHMLQKKHVKDATLTGAPIELPMLDVVQHVDPEHEMLRSCTIFSPELAPKPDGSIYDVDKKFYLDLYGKELPFKVEKWAFDEQELYKKISA